MEREQYEILFRVEDRHWFYQGQWAIASRLLARHLPATGTARILDAGCGTGGTSRRLWRFGQVVGMDVSALALAFARTRGIPCARGSVAAVPFADASFELVTCFDVLYHRQVDDDLRALRELRRVLCPGGLLLLRVPAFEALRRAHDVAVHTRRRYTSPELEARLQTAGYAVRVLTYANSVLLPLVLLRLLVERLCGAGQAELSEPAAMLNRLFTLVLSAEARALTRVRFPVGLSVIALAERV